MTSAELSNLEAGTPLYRVGNIGIYLVGGRERWARSMRHVLARQLAGLEWGGQPPVDYRLIVADYGQLPNVRKMRNPMQEALLEGGLVDLPDRQIALQEANATLVIWCRQACPVSIAFLLQFLLIPQGKAFCHAAGVSHAGRAIVVTGSARTGKTMLIGQLMEHPGTALLGDDLIICNGGGTVEGHPMPLTLYPDHRTAIAHFRKALRVPIVPATIWWKAVRKAFSAAGLSEQLERRVATGYALVPARAIYPEPQVACGALPVEAVYLLQRSATADRVMLRHAGVDEIASFLVTVTYSDWAEALPVLVTYLAATNASLSTYFQRVGGIVHGAVQSARRSGIITIPSSLPPAAVFSVAADLLLQR